MKLEARLWVSKLVSMLEAGSSKPAKYLKQSCHCEEDLSETKSQRSNLRS